MGGIAINEQGETSVKGLWACGEAVGGLHGANRLGGNALAEAIIFGSLVGARVEKAQNVPLLEEIQPQPLQDGDITLDELKKHYGKLCGSILPSSGVEILYCRLKTR